MSNFFVASPRASHCLASTRESLNSGHGWLASTKCIVLVGITHLAIDCGINPGVPASFTLSPNFAYDKNTKFAFLSYANFFVSNLK